MKLLQVRQFLLHRQVRAKLEWNLENSDISSPTLPRNLFRDSKASKQAMEITSKNTKSITYHETIHSTRIQNYAGQGMCAND
jgi:hypothetical protein